ncbi:MAG: MFS transporter [Mediterranea sp.]|jgi:MFS family permease|nr:MFS transporter [Mediterranea sp.]
MKANFGKVCAGNLLIFISQYMLFPILPVVMSRRLGISVAATGGMLLVMVLGMVFMGPFYSYLMDVYRRKSLCVFAFAVVFATTAGYTFVHGPLELLLLSLVQGFAFGVANSSIITLGIDVNVSDNRSKGNVIFGWFTRLGMILGAGSGSAIYLNCGFETLVAASVIAGCAGLLFVAAMRIPFRAPIGMPLCSTDRFFLPHTFLFMLNMILIAFVPGVLLPLIHFNMGDVFLPREWTVPYFAVVGGAFLLSVLLVGFLKRCSLLMQALLGMAAMTCSVCSLMLFDSISGRLLSAVLLGLGLSVITPAFLFFFINLSSHCQRSTANTTHLLSWKIGVFAGIAASCYLTVNGSSGAAFRAALAASVLAAVFFVLVSYPYYRKKKVR